MSHDEGQILHDLFSRSVPEGKVRWWVDDGQGGGYIEHITPEEAERRDNEDSDTD